MRTLLTKEEEREYNRIYDGLRKHGARESSANYWAWIELQRRFPRLEEFDGADN